MHAHGPGVLRSDKRSERPWGPILGAFRGLFKQNTDFGKKRRLKGYA